MEIFTLGFTKKSARMFFECVRLHRIELLLDIRLSNASQLAGFTKGGDLEFFLQELCACKYEHGTAFAPTPELMKGFQAKQLSQAQFETGYTRLMRERDTVRLFFEQYATYERICLLCSEDTPEHCHRRLLAQMIASAHADGAGPEVLVWHL